MYILKHKEIDEARKLLEQAESIFRKQSLHIAKVINDAHFTAINFLDEINSKPQASQKEKSHNSSSKKDCLKCDNYHMCFNHHKLKDPDRCNCYAERSPS